MTPLVERRVTVRPLSARAELLIVVRVAMAIAVGVWMYLASSASTLGGSGTAKRNLLPFQKLIADRPADEQRTFRELQEGLLEIEASRSMHDVWPTTETLATDGIPPFAPDPTRRVAVGWQRLQSGPTINYLGLPRDDGPAWLLLVQEPQPGVPPDQNFEDEEHHRLATGVMLHVSTWVRQDGRRVNARIVRLPQAEGWTQLYAVGPAAAGPALGNR
jgi:hypothetical protein